MLAPCVEANIEAPEKVGEETEPAREEEESEGEMVGFDELLSSETELEDEDCGKEPDEPDDDEDPEELKSRAEPELGDEDDDEDEAEAKASERGELPDDGSDKRLVPGGSKRD